MNYKEELDGIKNKIESEKNQKIRLEERLENLKKEKEEILKLINEQGIKQEELDSTIEVLETEIEEGIEQCKQILN